MSKQHGRLAAVVGLVVGITASGALLAQGDTASDYTVGDLAVRMAHDLGIAAPEVKPVDASAALAARGITITGDLTRPLLEKDVTEILNQLGLNLTTSRPERRVDEVKVGRLLDLVLGAVGAEGAGGVSTSDRGNSPPGGGFGRSKSQASPHHD